jgi:putative membrane protein
MKGLRVVIVTVLIAGALQACNNRHPQNYNTTTLAADSDGDTTPDTARKLHMVIDTSDTQFAIAAMNGGTTEVILGQLAMKNGKNKQVKNFGAMMVKDHSKANEKLMKIVKDKNITLPSLPEKQEQTLIDDLSQKTGSDFDKAYVKAMVDDHTEDVKEFTDGSKKLQDPDLKNFAIKTLPVIQNHLDKINAIRDAMK